MITPGGQTPKFWQENHIFLPKRYAQNAKIIEIQHFMKRSVRIHLNEHNFFLFIFFDHLFNPLGDPKMVKKLEFSRFYHILGVFEHFSHFQHETLT